MNRRTFLQTMGIAAVGASLDLPALAQAVPAAPAGVESLYRRGIVIDALTFQAPGFEVQRAIDGGLTAAVVDLPIYPRTFTNAVHAMGAWNFAMRQPESLFHKVLRAADIAEAKRQQRLGVILGCQDASILEAPTTSVNDFNAHNLGVFYDLGMRVLQITHNERNALGDSFREDVDAGLSRLGRVIVAEMNRLGMLIDLSHCGDRTTLQTIQLSKRPVAITHGGCRALLPTRRNKTDEHIRALAERGGFFGVYNMSLWLTKQPQPTVEHAIDHIDHVVKIGGIDCAGFGSDGPVLEGDAAEELKGMQYYVKRNQGEPGAEFMPEHMRIPALNRPDRLLQLAEGLARRGYGSADIEKIIGGNFLRVFGEACG